MSFPEFIIVVQNKTDFIRHPTEKQKTLIVFSQTKNTKSFRTEKRRESFEVRLRVLCGQSPMAAPPARARADYDYLIKLLLIGDSG